MMVHSIVSILGAKGSTFSVNTMPVSSNIVISAQFLTFTHTHTRTHSLTHSLTHTHALTHSLTHTQTRTHAPIHTK